MYQFKDHLGNVRLSYSDKSKNNTIEANEIIEETNYYPFGLAHKGYNQKNDALMKDYKYQYNGKEKQEELGLNYYDYGARNYDAAIGRWMNVDPLAEEFPAWTPYHYVHNNPMNLVDPTGMSANPVFDSDGNYLGNTIEGYTGEVIIYNGNKDISNMSADELLYDNFNVDTQRGEGNTYDRVRDELSGSAKSKIWTHVVSQLEGQQIYDERFSMNDLEGKKIYHNSNDVGSWNSRPKSINSAWNDRITGTDKYGYETTVENLQSSIVVHEWYSHIKKEQGVLSVDKSHRLAYKNVINLKSLWNKTTDNYKSFNLQQLENYTKKETGRNQVDFLYRRLYNKYINQ